MSLTALILAFLKAIPALERIWEDVERQRQDQRTNELHDAVKDGAKRIREGASVCPLGRECPLLRRVSAIVEPAKPRS